MPPIFQSAAGQLNVWVEQRALLITWVVLGAAAAAMAQRAPLHKDGRIQRHGAQGADEPGQGGAQLRPGVGADEDGGACGWQGVGREQAPINKQNAEAGRWSAHMRGHPPGPSCPGLPTRVVLATTRAPRSPPNPSHPP